MTPALALFTLTLFTSALLLFLLQPLIGKLILPFFGGTPAVWVTCMVFFQAVLLAGYRYADLLATRLPVRRQVMVHLALLLLPLAAFVLAPVGAAEGLSPSPHVGPALGAFLILFQLVGVPFFVVSSTAPLLQKWFGATDDPSARDPYFLYAASNLGSMIALLSFPFVLEPNLRLRDLGTMWMIGYGVLAVLIGACAGTVLRRPAVEPPPSGETPPAEPPPSWTTQLRWVALAFVPSSLMLGVTTHMTTDIAAVPLLWVIPLTLYLLSFILVFSRWGGVLIDVAILLFPVLVLLVVFLMVSEIHLAEERLEWRFAVHLASLFGVAMVCHGQLARGRPATAHLTRYYLCLSLGGVLGGVFNGLLAPLLFHTVAEYALVLVAACAFLPPQEESETWTWSDHGFDIVIVAGAAYFLFKLLGTQDSLPRPQAYGWKTPLLAWLLAGVLVLALARYVLRGQGLERVRRGLDVGLPVALGLLAFAMIVLQPFKEEHLHGVLNYAPALQGKLVRLATFLPLIVLCYGLAGRPVRFALGVGALFAASSLSTRTDNVLCRERSFFGVHRVDVDDKLVGKFHALMHGTTIHGMQRAPDDLVLVRAGREGALGMLAAADPLQAAVATAAVHDTLRDLRNEPMAYFHRRGPIGQFFAAMNLRSKPPRRIGILGLGSGTLLAYLRPGQHATIYEIDELAVRIAEDPRYFTYLRDTRGSYDIVMGDGRLKLAEAPDGHFDLLFMDAFSSDSIPVHLVTREAIELYFRKLAPDGVLVINIANRYLLPGPVLANIATELGLVGLTRYDYDGTQEPANLQAIVGALGKEKALEVVTHDGYVPGKFASSWVVLAREPEHFGLLTGSESGVEDEVRLNSLACLQRGAFVLPYLHSAFTLPTRRWEVLLPEPEKGVWTDDYSNLFRILNR